MAAASIDDILNIWKGLGYYNRAIHMHLTAQEIVHKWNGIFPDDYDRLLDLKGIGPYSAATIASIAFNHPYAVVDGNVIRVLSRLYALDIPMDDVAGRKIIQNQATSLLDAENPGIHNQAMMELGALICLPRNPRCSECPLSAWCKAYSQNKVQFFPVKSSRTKIRERHLNYFFIESEGHTVIKKRTGKDIWK
jgi:A/G-specific adenine glycosylase